MRPGGVFVHTSDVDIPSFEASLDVHNKLLHCLHVNLGETMDEDSSLRVLSDLQVLNLVQRRC
jgi:hypothetical protein